MAPDLETETAAAPTSPSPPLRMTYQEFLEWADEDTNAEWVDGEVVWMSPLSGEHQQLGRFLLRLLSDFVEEHNLGDIRYERFQMKLAPDLPGREPDLLFVAKANFSRLKQTYLDGPADLVVEIVNPDGRERDTEEKFREYQQGGVQEYWIVDRSLKQAEFYQLGADRIYDRMPVSDDGLFYSQVLPGLWLRVEWLWQDPLPRVRAIRKEWELVNGKDRARHRPRKEP
jgi:Uma2 family endonuclease